MVSEAAELLRKQTKKKKKALPTAKKYKERKIHIRRPPRGHQAVRLDVDLCALLIDPVVLFLWSFPVSAVLFLKSLKV